MKWTYDISKLYLWDKTIIADASLFMGLFLAYLGSLHPWFLWPLKELYVFPASALIVYAYVLYNSMNKTPFSRVDYVIPLIVNVLTVYYMRFVNSENINSYIQAAATIPILFAIFRLDIATIRRFVDTCCKVLAVGLLISLLAFFAHFFGIQVEPRSAVYLDNLYSFDNYLLFMIDDRSLMSIFPRFSSVFLEPGHLGSATSLLLMTQFGKWRKWYNVILFVVTLFTFSLAAYAIIVALLFLNLWVQRKNVVVKALVIVGVLASVVTASFFYNDGENMLHDAIILRLEIDEKTDDIQGNNRVTEDFEKEFDSYMTTSDVFLGRDMQDFSDEKGNSGYRVFIYEFGLIGTFLTLLIYIFAFGGYEDWRMLTASVVVALMIFWIRGYPLWYSNFIPLLLTALSPKPTEIERK